MFLLTFCQGWWRYQSNLLLFAIYGRPRNGDKTSTWPARVAGSCCAMKCTERARASLQRALGQTYAYWEKKAKCLIFDKFWLELSDSNSGCSSIILFPSGSWNPRAETSILVWIQRKYASHIPRAIKDQSIKSLIRNDWLNILSPDFIYLFIYLFLFHLFATSKIQQLLTKWKAKVEWRENNKHIKNYQKRMIFLLNLLY